MPTHQEILEAQKLEAQTAKEEAKSFFSRLSNAYRQSFTEGLSPKELEARVKECDENGHPLSGLARLRIELAKQRGHRGYEEFFCERCGRDYTRFVGYSAKPLPEHICSQA